MVELDIGEILEEANIDKADMETAIELGRQISDETGLCCEKLGYLIWRIYKGLQEGGGLGEEKE